jgi:hypothetical protein
MDKNFIRQTILLLGCLLSLHSACTLADPTPATTASLKPYQAIYSSSLAGIDVDLKQTLTRLDNSRWQLRNYVSKLVLEIDENAIFSELNGKLKPSSYHYRNNLNTKRNSSLLFNWSSSSVSDSVQAKTLLKLPVGTVDKLSFEAQLRLDLLNQQITHVDNQYSLVEQNKYKTYRVKYLREELLSTAIGTFNAIKLEQTRAGKDTRTLIWLAKDWDYFLLRIQRMEEGEEAYQIDLKEAVIDGEKLTGLPVR